MEGYSLNLQPNLAFLSTTWQLPDNQQMESWISAIAHFAPWASTEMLTFMRGGPATDLLRS